jgi:hypothetical protein
MYSTRFLPLFNPVSMERALYLSKNSPSLFLLTWFFGFPKVRRVTIL